MTKVSQKAKQKNVHLHIDKAFKIIDEHLPEYYVDLVKDKLVGIKISSSMIRKIRTRNTKYNLESKMHVIQAMVEVAIDHKKAAEKLQKTLTKIN